MKLELTQEEIKKAFEESNINDLKYLVNVDGKIFTADFTYGGLRDCQHFIFVNGKPDKDYKIRVVRR